MRLRKSTIIEGVASVLEKDAHGEMLDIDGADISPLKLGTGFVNSDHSGTFEHLLGRVVDAKKILKAADCDTQSQVRQWNRLLKPFIWTKLELWDGHGHREADAVASIYNFYRARNEEPPIKLSVEGKKLEKDSKTGVLTRTLIKGVALTVTPACKSTSTEVVGLIKNAGASSDALMKSDTPNFIEMNDSHRLERICQLMVLASRIIQTINSSRQ